MRTDSLLFTVAMDESRFIQGINKAIAAVQVACYNESIRMLYEEGAIKPFTEGVDTKGRWRQYKGSAEMEALVGRKGGFLIPGHLTAGVLELLNSKKPIFFRKDKTMNMSMGDVVSKLRETQRGSKALMFSQKVAAEAAADILETFPQENGFEFVGWQFVNQGDYYYCYNGYIRKWVQDIHSPVRYFVYRKTKPKFQDNDLVIYDDTVFGVIHGELVYYVFITGSVYWADYANIRLATDNDISYTQGKASGVNQSIVLRQLKKQSDEERAVPW